MDAEIISLEEQGQSLHIDAGQRQYVYPVAYFRAIVAGRQVEPLPTDVVRVIVREWLESLGVGPVRR